MNKRRSAFYASMALAVLILGLFVVFSSSTDQVASNANALSNPHSSITGPNPDAYSAIYPPPGPVNPISRTLNGYTITLYPVYATVNRIVLTYTVESIYEDLRHAPPDKPLYGESNPLFVAVTDSPEGYVQGFTSTPTPTMEPTDPTLTGENGSTFEWVSSSYSPLVFNIPQAAENLPSMLNLHLVLKEPSFVVPTTGSYDALQHSIRGPFVFDFSMPVDPLRRVVIIDQKVTTRDSDILTLSKLIVTRHDVRLLWKLEPATPGSSPIGWKPQRGYACCQLEIDIDGKPTYVKDAYYWGRDSKVLRDDIVDGSLIDKQGEWSITAWYISTLVRNSYDPPLPGPVFHFAVPPPINTLQR